MSQPMSSSNNDNLVRNGGEGEKDQSQHGYSSGAEQMTVEERELQRNIHSNALENAGDERLVEERVFPEGMGGAGGGDVEDVGDVGFPEEAGGGPISAQQRELGPHGRDQVLVTGMGGAGGGDADDIGDLAVGGDDASEGRAPLGGGELSFGEAWRMANNSEANDIDTRRTIGGGDTGTSGDMDMAAPYGGGTGVDAGSAPGSDVGAPWDRIDDASRLGDNPKPRI